ncbi:MAG: vitamin K epoxide reductase family protein [Chloroflexi bacterium]|nr:vitamin K epoxide reductase family protein [Chloroflexota bacterium]
MADLQSTHTEDAPEHWSRPWPHRAALVLTVAGLGISLYLSAVHLSSQVTLYCSQSTLVNCERVITSPASIVFGIPVAFFGVAWFLGMLLLLLAGQRLILPQIRLLWAIGGVGAVLYLIYTELFTIGVICLWCTSVHVLTVLIFALLVLFPDDRMREHRAGSPAQSGR